MIPLRAQWVTVVVLVAGTIATMVALGCHGKILETKGGHCIIALELAPTKAKAQKVIDDWSKAGLYEHALEDIRFDYAFIALYSTTLALLAFIGAQVLTPVLARVGPALGWSMWLAGALDVVENVGMTIELRGTPAIAPVVFAAAAVKWLLVIIGVVYGLVVVVGIAIALFRR